jgi:DNA-binding GntR family transcriptional regulator
MIERPKTITWQVLHLIQQRIESGEYSPNAKLPSEANLAKELGVSRSTIRNAMATLATRGSVIRKHGFGTYVAPRIPDLYAYLAESWDLSKRIETSGRIASVVAEPAAFRQATQDEAIALEIGTGDAVIVCRRVIYADEDPYMLSTNIISEGLFQARQPEGTGNWSIESFLTHDCLAEFTEVTTSIKAILCDPTSAESLQIESGMPILELTEIFFDQDRVPLTLGHNLYNGPDFRLRIVRPS